MLATASESGHRLFGVHGWTLTLSAEGGRPVPDAFGELDGRPPMAVSGRGESHPPALSEPGVRVSPHRAPIGRLVARVIRCQ